MGSDGFILKRKKDFKFETFLLNSIDAARKAHLCISVINPHFKDNDIFDYCTMNIGFFNIECDNFMFYIINPDEEDDELFNWVMPHQCLYRVGIIEDLLGNEKKTLDFIYEYLVFNPNDYFWSDCEWYYTFNDIKQIKESPYDPDWCYKPPKRYP